MSNDMIKICLGDYIDVITDYHSGGSYKTLKERTKILHEPSYAVMIRTINLENDNFSSDFVYCDRESYDFLEYSHVFENDILMNKIANPGSVYIMPKVDYPVTCGMNLFLIRYKNINQRYMYYVMKNAEAYIKSKAHGTTTKTITKDDVREIELSIHRDPAQRDRIERLLSDIDMKIQKSKRLIELLESITRTIYNYWFTQFDFPDDNGKPYSANKGEKVWCEELNRDIPTGWKLINVQEQFDFIKGFEPGAEEYCNEAKDDYVKFYRVADMDDTGSTYVKKKYLTEASVSEKELLVSFDGTVGKIGVGLDGVYSTGMRKISDKYGEISDAVIWAMFLSEDFQRTIDRYATGSNILHASEAINHLYFAYDRDVFENFDRIITPIYEKIVMCKKEIKQTMKIKEFIYPMLMNGQISI